MPQWSRPVAIPNQTSKTSSALALIRGRLHLIHLGESSDQLWHSTWDGARWSDNVRIGMESNGRVALAGEGLLVFQSKDGSGGLLYSVFQERWPLPQPVPDRVTTTHSPAAALTFGTWKVYRQVPNRDYQMAFSDYRPGAPGSIERIGGGLAAEFSAGVPALASDATGLHVIYLKDGSKDIWHSWAGGDRPVPNQSSRDSPAAASHNGVLHMAHIGSGSDTIWHTTFVNGQWTPNVPIPNHFSGKPPAMASAPDGLHMVHKGSGSDRIWHSIYR